MIPLAWFLLAVPAAAPQLDDPPSWVPTFGGQPATDGVVRALAVFDDGTGPALFAGGDFTSAGGMPANRIARWDGGSWTALGSGLNGPVHALAVHDGGAGPELYVGGAFTLAGGVAASCVAKWDGASWSALESGVSSNTVITPTVFALESHHDELGPALYAGGYFASAGGVPANSWARWDGESWWGPGPGLPGTILGWVFALSTHSDGGLYVGGRSWIANGSSVSPTAMWGSSIWWPIAGLPTFNPSAIVFAMEEYDDGTGPALYAAGRFTHAAGVPAGSIAKWDWTTWAAVAAGLAGSGELVNALEVHDDGSGPALFAGGDFSTVDGVGAGSLARWNGSTWSSLGSGTDGSVLCFAVYDDGSGPALFAGGDFAVALDSGDGYLAKWGRPRVDLEPPVLVHPEYLIALETLGGLPGELVSFTVTASDDLDPAPTVVCVPPSGSFFPHGTTLVTCTATDAAGHEAVAAFPVIVMAKARRP